MLTHSAIELIKITKAQVKKYKQIKQRKINI